MNTIELTQKLIQIESTNPGAYEGNIEFFITSYLSKCSAIKLQYDTVEHGRRNIIATIPVDKEINSGEVPSSHPINAEKQAASKLIWICHMDTVVVGDGWKKNPFAAEKIDNKIYGRGACDMKSGLACALHVFKETAMKVQKGELQLRRPLCLICTVDEEGDMKGVDHLIDRGFVTKEDWVMDLEPTNGEIQMAHKGRFWVELTVHGVTAHASKPEQGVDAIVGAAEIIRYIRKEIFHTPKNRELGRTTVTFGQIQGGYQPYVVPDRCKIWMDFRLAPPTTKEDIQTLLREAICLAKVEVKGVKIEYTITGDRPFVETNPESLLLKELQRAVEKVTGEKLNPKPFPGYTDTAVIAGRLGNKNCLSYGPGDLKYAHKPDEFVVVEDINRCEKVLRELVELL